MNQDKFIRITGLKYGFVLGVVLLAISIISFYVTLSFATKPVLFIMTPVAFTFILPIIAVILICFRFRKRIGGYWVIKQATSGIFIMFLVTYGIQTIGHDFIFAKLIEPNMSEKTVAATNTAANKMKKSPKVDKRKIDDNLAQITKNLELQKNITVFQVVSGFAINIILIFVFALIFGALFKRDPPIFVPADEV